MIDWHTHILPEMDDGAETRDISFAMLDELQKQGFREVFATPHFYPETGESIFDFLDRRQRCHLALKDHAFYPHIHLGAEVSLSVDLLEMEHLDALTMGDTPYILLELPYEDWQEWVYQIIFAIEAKYKVKPIIAHVDRYFDIVRDKKKIWRLTKLDYILQFNTSVVQYNRFHPVYKLLKGYKKIIFGTDAHNMTFRPPRLEEEKLEKKLGSEKWTAINRYSKILFCGG